MIPKASFFLQLIIIGSCLIGGAVYGQDDLSGQINDYSAVLGIEDIGEQTHLEIVSAADFSVDDEVLIIQMKGASIELDDSEIFGSILSYNNCGNFEFSRIASIEGDIVQLTDTLCQDYSIDGLVQLIRVPEPVSANISAEVIAQNWNGATGGVIVMDIKESLTLLANINASGSGFRGGTITNNPDGGCGVGSPSFFYNPDPDPGDWWTIGGGAEKGEGIAILPDDQMAGKGAIANGGGGGNKHNNGGGGGGNYTMGGIGGNALAGCSNGPGIGGYDLQAGYEANKLFMGGGGGCGDDNNTVGSPGTNGGGIIIIRVDTIIGNGFRIISEGLDQLIVGGAIADGAGGGGGGGAIYLVCSNYIGDLDLVANGGDGGDQNPTWGCVGPGGGGGTGVVVGCEEGFPAEVTVEVLPGSAGVFIHDDLPGCPLDSSFGAEDGVANEEGPIILDDCLWACSDLDIDEDTVTVVIGTEVEPNIDDDNDTTDIIDPPIVVDPVDTVIVVDPYYLLEMPNVFTPNGDNFNDAFIPTQYLGIADAELTIVDRWGVTLFITNDLEAGWNGYYRGKPCTEGVYYWTIIYTTNAGLQNASHGFFHLK